jgi:hypothetical protein
MNNNAFPKRRAPNRKKCVIKVSKNGKWYENDDKKYAISNDVELCLY